MMNVAQEFVLVSDKRLPYMRKRYFRDASTFQPIAVGFGSCIASDRIVVEGVPVGLMYREEPDNSFDSGWRFLAGNEPEEYMENPGNFGLFDVNTLANYDPTICQHLDSTAGTTLVRDGDIFRVDKELKFPAN
jgi:hypothetical protein